jgi:phenylacetaldehyde dehydrogenase
MLDQVTDALADLARNIVLAPGLDPACEMGPVISRSQQTRILGFVERAEGQGLQNLTRGITAPSDGFFVPPTVLLTSDNRSEAMQEEIFGPVLTVMPFDDADEALMLANDTPYGLGASVWTRDVAAALNFGRAVNAGSVWINAHDLVDSVMPFGGFTGSGHGKDMGREQFDACLKTKSLWVALG